MRLKATSAGVPGLEPRTSEPESLVLPITPYPKGRLRITDSLDGELFNIRASTGQQHPSLPNRQLLTNHGRQVSAILNSTCEHF